MNQPTCEIIPLNLLSGSPVHYSFANSPFGKILLASTPQGLCSVRLAEEESLALVHLRKEFPKAFLEAKTVPIHQLFMKIFDKEPVKLTYHLQGTPFQLEVWNALLDIPFGQTTTYGSIARRIGKPKACRAVGTAVGGNPIFYAIPCHRVLPAAGGIGHYFWGPEIKKQILDWETEMR